MRKRSYAHKPAHLHICVYTCDTRTPLECWCIFKRFFILTICLFSFICVYCVRVYTTYVPGAPRGQKRASNPLELELWVVVNHYVGAGNQTWVI